MADERAQQLRKNSTGPERKLWAALGRLREQGFHFRRQARFGRYIVDFVSHRERLVVEVDGAQHYEVRNARRDEIRTEYLAACGYRVMRFSNYEVLQNVDWVLEEVVKVCVERKRTKFAPVSGAVPPPEHSRPGGLERSTAPQRGR